MAFRDLKRPDAVPDSPEKLFPDLPRRKIPGVLPHQLEQMMAYSAHALEAEDVAIQLPTGSGKTLVGLLIAEWRRRKYGEKVVYLAPTKQLVNQVVEQAEEKYGITAYPFTGMSREYSPDAKAAYVSGSHIAVTTYSSLFNTNPFFSDPDIIIMDDAHASENYVSAMWSVRIERTNPDHSSLHEVVSSLLRPILEPFNYSRLMGEIESPTDRAWVEKLPTPELMKINNDLTAVLDEYSSETDVSYPWQMIRGHLDACHLYMTSQEILIRPLIPPTWDHQPFAGAKQRIYMSATLGEGGDLERLVGRKNILRLPISEGWDNHGVGRRFFIFPGMSLSGQETKELRAEMMKVTERSLVLVPSMTLQGQVSEQIDSELEHEVFDASDIEDSKSSFTQSEAAVAVVANRYDGIDFPGDECRLLFIEGLPRATNAQERFLMSKMGANVLFNERIQTRVLQAIGRCTRSLEDYSAVVVTGEELPDYLADSRKRQYFHPELQAELYFGVEQSKAIDKAGLLENLKIFLENGEEWEAVNDEIVSSRRGMTKVAFPAMEELHTAVEYEISYQMKMWQKDYEAALGAADRVLAELKSPDLRGYRAAWHYLAGSAAWLASETGGLATLMARAKDEYGRAKDAAPMLPWLVPLSRYIEDHHSEDEVDEGSVLEQIENIESVLTSLGTTYDRSFVAREKEIIEGLQSKDNVKFEHAHRLLGELLGFESGNRETTGAPDPWWISSNVCIVFEDHAGAEETSSINVTKARQVSSHPQWMRANVSAAKTARILPVLVTPCTKADSDALPHLENVAYWKLADFQDWAKSALAIIRELRGSFVESGDLTWRATTSGVLKDNGFDAISLVKRLEKQSAKDMLET